MSTLAVSSKSHLLYIKEEELTEDVEDQVDVVLEAEEDEDEENEEDEEEEEEDEEDDEEDKDTDSLDESLDLNTELPGFTLPGVTSQEPGLDQENMDLLEGATFQVPDAIEWEQQNQGLGKSLAGSKRSPTAQHEHGWFPDFWKEFRFSFPAGTSKCGGDMCKQYARTSNMRGLESENR
ncbi:PREDICTED: uncharacterized protein C14orf37-like, partial [Galeopterus variegatus]|uniref:Uncharacterized protein C14orf37-like n=1 Tax=Galeopterus variegatus TaxID=482537 RepID=A0ABM0PYR7_GALVR